MPRNTLTALALGALTCFAGTYMLLSEVFLPQTVSTLAKSVLALLDAALIMLPMLFLPPAWRRSVCVPCVVLPLLVWCNLIYARSFHHPIPALSYIHHSGAGSFMWDALKASAGPADALLLLLGAGTAVFAIVRGRRMAGERRLSRRFRLAWLAGLGAVWSAAFFLSVRRMSYSDTESPTVRLIEYRLDDVFSGVSWRAPLANGGFTEYAVSVVSQLLKPGVTLTDDDRLLIQGRLADAARSDYREPSPRRDNLIFIVVESLNSFVTRLPEFPALMPVLHSLVECDTTALVALSVEPQVRVGRSTDGQFIYNTGLLPLRGECFAIRYAQADYPSLVKALRPASSMEVIGENRALYSHGVTSLSYGYESLSDDNMSLTDRFESDSLIFSRALSAADSLPRPFLLEITTITSHDPFNDQDPTCSVELSGEITRPMRGYLHSLHRFDRALGQFLDSLKSRGLYDSSVIVIASDHDVKDSAIEPEGSDIMALILNASDHRIEVRERRRQSDLFPTILDVTGVNSGYVPAVSGLPYRGLGRSMLLPADTAACDDSVESDFEISEMIIRGRYFQP